MDSLKLYDYAASANCYKVRLLLAQLERPYERIPIDIFGGDTLTDEYEAKNPARATPVLETGDGRLLPESNAILLYLAQGTPFLPADPFDVAQVVRWLLFEQTDVMMTMGGLRFRLVTGRFGADSPDAVRRRAGSGGDAAAARPPPRGAAVPRRRRLHDRRHRRLRLHARRPGGRDRSRAVPGAPGLARPGGGAAALPERPAAVSGERAGRSRQLDLRLRHPPGGYRHQDGSVTSLRAAGRHSARRAGGEARAAPRARPRAGSSPASSSSTSTTSATSPGFGFLATERPVAVAANASGELAVFVPEFEVERVRDETAFERVESYPEYPGLEHPMRILGRVLADLGIAAARRRTATATRASSATRARR